MDARLSGNYRANSQFVLPGSVRVAWSEMEQLASVAFLTPVGKVVPVFQTR